MLVVYMTELLLGEERERISETDLEEVSLLTVHVCIMYGTDLHLQTEFDLISIFASLKLTSAIRY